MARQRGAMTAIGWFALVGGSLYVLHRLAIWMERRGWIHYRRRGVPGTLGNAFLEVQSFLEPGKRPTLEARKADAVEQDDAGDPPDPGLTPGPARPPGRSR